MDDLVWADPRPVVRRGYADGLRTPPQIPLDEWADGRLVLPREMSPEPGVMRLSRTPYLRDILAALDDPNVEEVVLQCGTQLGKSTVLLVAMAKVIAHSPAPMMFVQPTIDMAKRFSRQRIAALIRANPILRDTIKDTRSRDSGNTLLVKEFPGGILVMCGANSGASLASMPALWVLCDEIDDYPDDVDGQGEPIALAIARQDSFGSRARRCFVSSPKKARGTTGIESRRQVGTDERYEIPCPHCGEYQELEWGADKPYGVKWESKDGRPLLHTVAYACRHCAALIPESAKTVMLEAGRWVQTNPGARSRSFLLSSLYSPLGWLSWRQIVAQWVRAQDQKRRGNLEPLKAFVNMRLAQTWDEQGTALDAAKLQEKAEAFPLRLVPANALVLLAGVDTQDDRLEVAVWAIGPRGAMWTVDTIVIVGNPAEESTWSQLEAALSQRYEHADGFDVGIEAVAIDSGGHYTHEVYNFVRKQPTDRKVFAIKGVDKPGMGIVGKPSLVDVNWGGGVVKGGCRLWSIGVHAAKDRLAGLMRAEERMVHLSAELDPEFFTQITAEVRVQQKTARGNRFVWVKRKGQARNEQLDMAVYVLWLVEKLRIGTWTPRMWDAVRAALEDSARAVRAQAARPAIEGDAAPPQLEAPEPRTVPAPRRQWMDETDPTANWF
jgi:phage terminase large subunit GpA-like protein